jgi:hypothetical protein
MGTVQVKAQLTTDDLVQAARQLSLSELEKFVWQIITLKAHRVAPGLSKNESELLIKINRGIPSDIQQRFDNLVIKRRKESLTEKEYGELLQLTDQIEKMDFDRVEYLSKLAHIRKTSLSAVMKDLNIQIPAYG